MLDGLMRELQHLGALGGLLDAKRGEGFSGLCRRAATD